MNLFQTTGKWSSWWANRKIDWVEHYLKSWQHPHRTIISSCLNSFPWFSLIEVGCGAGANLRNIVHHFKDRQLGGIDINPDAIAVCKKAFTDALFKVNSVEDIMLSDNMTDVILSDMCLIYIGPRKIDQTIKEIKRVARKYIVFCEFHSDSLWMRLKLRFTRGYFAYDYRTLLAKHGFHDIEVFKLGADAWDGHEPQLSYAYIIRARVPRRK